MSNPMTREEAVRELKRLQAGVRFAPRMKTLQMAIDALSVKAEAWEPTPAQYAEIANLDGPLSRGEIHPVDYIRKVLSAAPTAPKLCEDEGCPHHGTSHICVEPAPSVSDAERAAADAMAEALAVVAVKHIFTRECPTCQKLANNALTAYKSARGAS
jgi:hypothetical protein